MKLVRLALWGAVITAGISSFAMAEYGNGHTTAYVVRAPDAGLLHGPGDIVPSGKRWVDVIPGLTGVEICLPHIRHDHRLDRYDHLRLDRILPYQAELLIANATLHYVPLYIDYRSQARPRNGGIDEDHSIVRSQRLMLGLTTGSRTHVVRNPLLKKSESLEAGRILPQAVIHVPDSLRRPEGARPIPQKKRPVKEPPDQIALSR